MKHWLLSLPLLLAALAVQASPPTATEVQTSLRRGDYVTAEQQMAEVVAADPNSAKVHYVYAQVLAHEGKFAQAQAQAEQAQQIDPAIHFADPARFQSFERELQQANHAPQGTHTGAHTPYATTQEPIPHARFPWLLILLAAAVAIIVLLLARRARNGAYTGYGNGNIPPPSGTPPGYPGYGSGYGPAYVQPPSHGLGSAIAGGLGGLATGMLLERALDGRHETDMPQGEPLLPLRDSADYADDRARQDLENRPVDFGSNDSWDLGGSNDGVDFGNNDDSFF